MWGALAGAALSSGGGSGGQGGQGGGGMLSKLPNPAKGFATGAMQYLGGQYGQSGLPYEMAGKAFNGTFDKYMPGAQAYLDPYAQGGASAMGNYSNALSKMQDPNAYVNGILNNYQESPMAAFERKYGNQGMSYANSASGMQGSGAAMKAAADYNQQLTSRDMQTYLNNILGVNRDLLSGYSDMSHIGAGAAGQQSQNAYDAAKERANMNAQSAYGQTQGAINDKSQAAGGLAQMGMSLFGMG